MNETDGSSNAQHGPAGGAGPDEAPAAPRGGVGDLPSDQRMRQHPYFPSLILFLLGTLLLTIGPLLPSPSIPAAVFAEAKPKLEPKPDPAELPAPPPGGAETPREKNLQELLQEALKSEELPERGAAVYVLVGACWMIGMGCFVTFLFLYLVSVDFRRRLGVWSFVARPPPALHMVDAIGVCALIAGVWMTVRPAVLSAWQAAGGTWDLRILVVLGLFVQFAGYAAGLAGLVWAARKRKGPSGSAGLWPFWSCAAAEPPSAPAKDAALGASLYFLCYWMMFASALVNVVFVTLIGIPITQNPLLDLVTAESAGGGRFFVLGLMFVFAVFGAAFFEELIFRGFLYNVLKRHASPLVAAILCSAIFALVHNVPSQILPLFTLSMLLIYAYERSGRLLAPMVLHALNNAIAMGLVMWAYGG
ncbi:MAG: CPBP family intramembrane metalloprotease [Planctomycetota bacterium]|nr:CPBP family intramembrane metalloprotease [Planctomycetota bacterium]